MKTMKLPVVGNKYHCKARDMINEDFRVWLNGEEVTAYNCRCSAVPFNRVFGGNQRSIEQTELQGFVSFEHDGEVCVEVEAVKPFEKVTVRPLSKGIRVENKGGRVAFTLKNYGQYTVEFDDEHTCLNLFFKIIIVYLLFLISSPVFILLRPLIFKEHALQR